MSSTVPREICSEIRSMTRPGSHSQDGTSIAAATIAAIASPVRRRRRGPVGASMCATCALRARLARWGGSVPSTMKLSSSGAGAACGSAVGAWRGAAGAGRGAARAGAWDAG
jgi:hypothetical protein